MDNSIYWSMKRARSYGCSLNFIIGPRGPGKTYALTKYCVEQFIKAGHQFIWVRRFTKEVKECAGAFLRDMLKNEEFPGHELAMKGRKVYVDGKIAGELLALATADDRKSSPTPDVYTLVFDEFIIDNGAKGYRHYLPGEITTFLNLISSTVRQRPGWSVWLLANAVTVNNPYFIYWNIALPYGKDIARVKDDILIEYFHNTKFAEAAKESQFGHLVAGTEYAEYAIDNKFRLDDNTFICKRPGAATYYFTLRFNGREYGVYADYETGRLFISPAADPKYPVRFALTDDDHRPNTLIVKGRRNPYLQNLANCYGAGAVFYDDKRTKAAMRRAIAML